MTCHSILRTMPQLDSSIRIRVNAEAVATISAVTTVSTVTNLSQLGGVDGFHIASSISRVAADNLRRNITVT